MSKSIKLKDNTYIDSTGIVHNRTLLSDKLNKMGSFVKAIMTNDYTVQATGTIETLPINSIASNSGNVFTISNNGIKVGAGVSVVLVSASVYWYQNCANSEGIIYLYKNNSQLSTSNKRLADNYEHHTTAMIPVTVSEGDIIYLKVNNQHATPSIKNYSSGTFLNVIAIK